MVEKKMVSAKIAERTAKRLDQLAEREGISRSAAIDRMLKQGLDVEESDMRLVPVQTDGGTVLENKIDTVQNSLESYSNDLQRQEQNQVLLNVTLIGALVWIFLQLFYSFPSWFTVISGIGLMLALLGLLWKVLKE